MARPFDELVEAAGLEDTDYQRGFRDGWALAMWHLNFPKLIADMPDGEQLEIEGCDE